MTGGTKEGKEKELKYVPGKDVAGEAGILDEDDAGNGTRWKEGKHYCAGIQCRAVSGEVYGKPVRTVLWESGDIIY